MKDTRGDDITTVNRQRDRRVCYGLTRFEPSGLVNELYPTQQVSDPYSVGVSVPLDDITWRRLEYLGCRRRAGVVGLRREVVGCVQGHDVGVREQDCALTRSVPHPPAQGAGLSVVERRKVRADTDTARHGSVRFAVWVVRHVQPGLDDINPDLHLAVGEDDTHRRGDELPSR